MTARCRINSVEVICNPSYVVVSSSEKIFISRQRDQEMQVTASSYFRCTNPVEAKERLPPLIEVSEQHLPTQGINTVVI